MSEHINNSPVRAVVFRDDKVERIAIHRSPLVLGRFSSHEDAKACAEQLLSSGVIEALDKLISSIVTLAFDSKRTA